MSHDHPLKEEVSFLKRLAAQGGGEPAPLAWLLAVFGLVYGLMFLLWAVLAELGRAHAVSFSQFNAIMVPVSYAGHLIFVLALIGAGAQMWLTRHRRPKVNAVAGAAWAAAFVALVVSVGCMLFLDGHSVRIFRFRNFLLTIGALPSFALILYGVAWWVAAAATRQTWAYIIAFFSFCEALMWAYSLQRPSMMMVTPGVSLLTLAFVPGLIIALRARRRGIAP